MPPADLFAVHLVAALWAVPSVMKTLDPPALVSALAVSLLIAALFSLRARQQLAPAARPHWTATLTDTLLGGLLGGLGAFALASALPALNDAPGVLVSAALGGSLGLSLAEFLRTRGLDLLLAWALRRSPDLKPPGERRP
ncbi:hypothetical protein Deipr_2011 [Deinococcus proteolyticus MRP]|uniref:Uncharacterized protein n=1 Tax=Deinococcus proteolyticus (strain ATCC 35074 / DSM 20540 / JCM 6276 / NBRC 101906 / NCIMB 13154 / VKM Ac-1939 / CCM 2703 / MRP) TaxID=693977 RepID=F0RMS4_DEIPM|nr:MULTISPECIES: hypothetical protein [Deinococcus]ADY27142.1 hypothetical protein Deipr_2011 [Deinococcus proteolyticus MRP]MCY1703267.1 hypothetical protein [Deinococcus sp. SL84]